MRWYVNIGGQTTGPVEEAELLALVRGGLRDATVRDEAGGAWTALAQSPFAGFIVGGPKTHAGAGSGEALGAAILLLPVLATVLVWTWIAQMNMFQNPGGSLYTLAGLTIFGSASLVAIDASQAGMGSRLGSNGKMESGPVLWFVSVLLLWVLALPWYLHKRRYFGRRPYLVAGILVATIFIGSVFVMGRAIEERRMEIKYGIVR